MAEEESLKKDPIAYSKRLLHLAEHGDYEGLAAWIANDGSIFNGVHVCRSTGLRAQGSVNNRFLASGEFFAELGRVRPGVTVMVVVKGRGYLAPAAAQRYAHPGGACVLKQQGGNQITKTHQSEELEKFYFGPDDDSYLIVDPACAADPSPHSYRVRVTVWCRSEDFAEEISEEEGLDVVHILEVSKCQQKNYGRPSKKPRAAATKKPARRRRSPPAPREPLSPATVAPPSPQSPGSKIDAALASPDAPPPPQSSPDEPAALPEWESRFL